MTTTSESTHFYDLTATYGSPILPRTAASSGTRSSAVLHSNGALKQGAKHPRVVCTCYSRGLYRRRGTMPGGSPTGRSMAESARYARVLVRNLALNSPYHGPDVDRQSALSLCRKGAHHFQPFFLIGPHRRCRCTVGERIEARVSPTPASDLKGSAMAL